MLIDERENVEGESGGDNNPSGVDYIETIKQLKSNTVPKSDYEKLQEENKKLLQSLVNGETITPEGETTVDIDALRKELFGEDPDMSNLEYMTKAIELRDALIEAGSPDPFLPYGKKIMPTEDDIATANRVAAVIKECIEYAGGDSQIFTNELQRRMIDVSPATMRRK